MSHSKKLPKAPYSDTSEQVTKLSSLITFNFGPKTAFILPRGCTAMLAEHMQAVGSGEPPGLSAAPTKSHGAAVPAGDHLKQVPSHGRGLTAHTQTPWHEESSWARSLPARTNQHPVSLSGTRPFLPHSSVNAAYLSSRGHSVDGGSLGLSTETSWGAEAAMREDQTETLRREAAPWTCAVGTGSHTKTAACGTLHMD